MERRRRRGARVRLAALWVSQAARVLADGCLRLVAMLAWVGTGETGRLSAWHVATAVFIAPFILLAPLNGCLSNALPRRWVLSASAGFSLLVLAGFALADGPWLPCLGLVALGAAVNSAARYALLPAGARDSHLPLTRVSGWIELGAAAAVVASVPLGAALPPAGWPQDGGSLGLVAGLVLVGLNLLSFLTALPAAFPSDLRRPERPVQAVRGFFRDVGRVARDRAARTSLAGLAGFQALVTAGAGAVVADTLSGENGGLDRMMPALVLAMVGTALGAGAAGLQSHPRRALGLVSFGSVGLVLCLVWALHLTTGNTVPLAPCLLLGFLGGLLNVPLRAAYLAAIPVDARGNGTAVMNVAIYTATAVLAGTLVGLTEGGLLTSPLAQLGFLAVLAGGGAALSCWVLLPQTLELVAAWLLWPMYRVHAHGPGVGRIPLHGPLLIVANHTAYTDPFWLGKVLPRRLVPLMTSVFFDKPVLRWLMRRVVRAIRVPAVNFRREAKLPELCEAVEVLRRGGCVLIFPEAVLRRSEDELLRPFGQGVWRILREVPQTRVVVCWIEGGWGSFASYWNGPPLQNKLPDWRRWIGVAIAEPETLPAEVLADGRATRAYLMRACLECRRHLGLGVPDEASQVTGPMVDPHGINA
jgi:1-acyl-sn-glycerol-3-phosphate acyltransferase